MSVQPCEQEVIDKARSGDCLALQQLLLARCDEITQHITPKLPLYWFWLLRQIVKANLAVTKIILSPRLPISPTVVRVRAGQKSDLAKVIYANSITLTPGTVSINLDDDHIEVHALTTRMAADLQTSEMERRVSRLEKSR